MIKYQNKRNTTNENMVLSIEEMEPSKRIYILNTDQKQDFIF